MDVESSFDFVSNVDIYRIIEKVRQETDIPHTVSCHVTSIILENLIPLLPTSASLIIKEMLKYFENPIEVPASIIDHTEDMLRLIVISKELQTIKNDSQQRSWELFEDEAIIIEYLVELNSILKFADVAISKKFLSSEDFSFVNCLAEYYQMEVRWSIRIRLLDIFSTMCRTYQSVNGILLNSVLPLELSRDIEHCTDNKTRLVLSIKVLTTIFCAKEHMPVNYLDSMGEQFILHLLDLMKQFDIPEKIVKFILVYNQQFSTQDVQANVIVGALLKFDDTKMFTETLLFLLNRGDDPVKEEIQEPEFPNSMLKLMAELFSSKRTIELFYKNDLDVLVSIVVRQLTDLSPEDKEREEWLILAKQIFLNCDCNIYKEYLPDLQSAFNRISKEETSCPKSTIIEIIEEITNTLTHI